MTRVLTALGLLVLLVAVVPAGAYVTLVLVAGSQPFEDQRVLAPLPGGVDVVANSVAVTVVASPDAAVHVTTSGTESLTDPSITVGSAAMPEAPAAPAAPAAPQPASSTSVADTGTGRPSAARVAVSGCWRCALTVQLAVPPTGRVRVTGSPTTLSAVGVAAPLSVEVARGPITVRDFTGPAIDADTADGPITVALRRSATATATTANGDITVTAPASGRYALDPQSANGTVTATLPDDPASPDRITAHTASGNVVLTPP